MGLSRTPAALPVSGAQSIERAGALLRLIAAGHSRGTSLRQLVEATALDRTTAWRMLSSLQHQGLVRKDVSTGLYRLGVEAMALGAASMDRPPVVDDCLPVMKALARLSGDNVFLVVRSGDHSHCLHLEEGAHAVRSFALNVGGTRLLGMGVGSIALLARLPAGELEQHHRRHAAEYQTQEVSLGRLRRWAAQARELGYAHVTAGGVAGVGMGFALGSCGDAAMSVIAPRSRLPRARADELAQAMLRTLVQAGLQV